MPAFRQGFNLYQTTSSPWNQSKWLLENSSWFGKYRFLRSIVQHNDFGIETHASIANGFQTRRNEVTGIISNDNNGTGIHVLREAKAKFKDEKERFGNNATAHLGGSASAIGEYNRDFFHAEPFFQILNVVSIWKQYPSLFILSRFSACKASRWKQ